MTPTSDLSEENEGGSLGVEVPLLLDEDWTPTESEPPKKVPSRRPAWITPPRLVEKKRCNCGVWIWTGYDADVLAWLATVDYNVFLSPEGEARALLRGRKTYEYETSPRRVIEAREWWNRETRVPGEPNGSTPEILVCCSHICGRPIPDWARFFPAKKRRRKINSYTEKNCPF